MAISSANFTRGYEGLDDWQSVIYKVNRNGASTVSWDAPVLLFKTPDYSKHQFHTIFINVVQ